MPLLPTPPVGPLPNCAKAGDATPMAMTIGARRLNEIMAFSLRGLS